jgi:hypothetical protein
VVQGDRVVGFRRLGQVALGLRADLEVQVDQVDRAKLKLINKYFQLFPLVLQGMVYMVEV